MANKTLDTRGLACPLPILKAKKAMMNVPPGGTLEVLATDPGAREDFRVFCETSGYRLLSETDETGGILRVLIQRQP